MNIDHTELKMVDCTTLKTANEIRNKEWDNGQPLSLDFFVNELLGEVGEAANIAKKLYREQIGIRGSRAKVGDFAKELADVVIVTNLITNQQGLELADPSEFATVEFPTAYKVTEDINRRSLRMGVKCGHICDRAFRDGFVPVYPCHDLVLASFWCAKVYDIDLVRAIKDKFNETTVKQNLHVRYI